MGWQQEAGWHGGPLPICSAKAGSQPPGWGVGGRWFRCQTPRDERSPASEVAAGPGAVEVPFWEFLFSQLKRKKMLAAGKSLEV